MEASRHERIGSRAVEQELDTRAGDDRGTVRRRGPAGGSRDGQEAAREGDPAAATGVKAGRDQGEGAREAGGDRGSTVRRRARAHGGPGGEPDAERAEGEDGGERDSSEDGGERDVNDGPRKKQPPLREQERRAPKGPLSARDAARAGMRGLADVISSEPVGVTEVSPRHDGWLVAVEVVELERLPSSADILALYETELDWDGRLRSYRRIKRYTRGHGEGGA